MDLAWHIRGKFASALTLEPKPFPPPVENGYCAYQRAAGRNRPGLDRYPVP